MFVHYMCYMLKNWFRKNIRFVIFLCIVLFGIGSYFSDGYIAREKYNTFNILSKTTIQNLRQELVILSTQTNVLNNSMDSYDTVVQDLQNNVNLINTSQKELANLGLDSRFEGVDKAFSSLLSNTKDSLELQQKYYAERKSLHQTYRTASLIESSLDVNEPQKMREALLAYQEVLTFEKKHYMYFKSNQKGLLIQNDIRQASLNVLQQILQVSQYNITPEIRKQIENNLKLNIFFLSDSFPQFDKANIENEQFVSDLDTLKNEMKLLSLRLGISDTVDNK